MAAVVYRGRSLRSRRLKGRQDNGDEVVTLDFSKAPEDNLKEVLTHLVQHHVISKSKRLGYLNAFVRLCYRYGGHFSTELTQDEILACLRLGLFHEAKEMRAGCLRALRFFCQNFATVHSILTLRIDFLIARSLDLCLDNELERIHSLRLTRKIMHLAPAIFPTSLLSSLVSIAQDGGKERDRMVRACLATLCEFVFMNPSLAARCGVINAVIHNVLDCHQLPRINESLLAAILYLLNHPRTRHLVKPDVEIEQLLAPFTDCHYKLRGDSSESTSSSGEERENLFAACKMALGTLMKSWPGIIRLCRPDSAALQSLIGVLYLPHSNTRKEIMDLLFDVFRLPLPEWTDNFSQALISVDISEMRESWRVTECFVAEEGKVLLPHLAKTRPNFVDNHIALILSAFVNAGMLEALVEVITTSDRHVSVRATVLVGELLHLANTILPHECAQHTHCLPTLMARATNFNLPSNQQNNASQAVNCLNRLHAMKRRGPVPCTLFLDRIVQSGKSAKEEPYKPLLLNKEKLVQAFEQQDSDHDVIHQAIKDSNVLHTKENFAWDWDLISTILKWPDEALRKFDEQSNQRFIRRVLYFYKPTNKLFSVADLGHKDVKSFSLTGVYFVDFLLSSLDNIDDASKLIEEFLGDINRYLAECCQPMPPQDSLFSPSHLAKTCSQYYFLIIGRFTATSKGERFLESTGVYQSLLNLITSGCHDNYVKLIVSSLDYSKDGIARELLAKALKSTSETAKLYTVNLMRVLLRAKVPYISNWGLEMLVTQLYDQSKSVAMEALSVISEACENEANLHSLVKLRPSVLHLGHKGAMLLARFLSIPKGFRFLQEANYITRELEKWHQVLCVKYVHCVEERLNEALTTYEKTYDGTYVRRSHHRQPRNDVFVPVHLYGQLVQHKHGFQLLEHQDHLDEYFEAIRSCPLHSDQEIMEVKAALWAVGHIGTSVWGLGLLLDKECIPEIIKLAEESGVFSIRGTAFFVLGLIASTRRGADTLNDYGWETVRHCHGDMWPVMEEGEVDRTYSTNTSIISSMSSSSLSSGPKSEAETPRSISHVPSYPKMTSLSVSGKGLEITDSEQDPLWTNPNSEGSSPKVSFFVGSYDSTYKSRSRSNTEASVGQLGSSYEEPLDLTAPPNDPQKIMIEISQPPEDSKRVSLLGAGDAPAGLSEARNEDNVDGKIRSSSMFERQRPKELVQGRSHSDPPERRIDKSDRKTDGAFVHFNIDTSDEDEEEEEKTVISTKIPLAMGDYTDRANGASRGSPMGKTSEQLSVCEDRPSMDSPRVTPTTANSSNKSRSDSLHTDTSSGFSSFDSSHYQCTTATTTTSELAQLSPIPSASSLVSERTNAQKREDYFHPSDYYRKQANLKRMSGLKRHFASPIMGHISPSSTLDRKSPEKSQFTSARDIQGYATLQELKRQRTIACDLASQAAAKGVIDEGMVSPYAKKTRSLDFRLGKFSSSSTHHPSVASLEDTESSVFLSPSSADLGMRPASTSNLRKLQGSGGRAEYAGICLPADISMIFHVAEGEDSRSNRPKRTSQQAENPYSIAPRVQHGSPGDRLPVSGVGSGILPPEDNVLEYHSATTCMSCMRIQQVQSTDEAEGLDSDQEDTFFAARDLSVSDGTPSASAQPSPMAGTLQRSMQAKSRNSSVSDVITGSITSITSLESAAASVSKPALSEDTAVGKALLRKEVLRFVVNLSSSVGVKSAEQGLLTLKQKFPRVFHDLCFYSEICCMLAEYRYRLTARRFIQELFQEVSYDELYIEPREILKLDDNPLLREQRQMDAEQRLERVLESVA